MAVYLAHKEELLAEGKEILIAGIERLCGGLAQDWLDHQLVILDSLKASAVATLKHINFLVDLIVGHVEVEDEITDDDGSIRRAYKEVFINLVIKGA